MRLSCTFPNHAIFAERPNISTKPRKIPDTKTALKLSSTK